MQKQQTLRLEKNLGIIGDRHAKIGSPRQVLITTSEDYKALGLQHDQLRANIILEGISLDQIQSGDEIRIGSAHVRVTYICEPCRHLFEVAGFETDDWPTLIEHRGMLGVVTNSGDISLDQPASIVKSAYSSFPDSNFDRFCSIIKAIPNHYYLSYNNIVFLMGAPKAYVRALPGYIKKAEALGINCSSTQAQEDIEALKPEQLWDFSDYFQN